MQSSRATRRATGGLQQNRTSGINHLMTRLASTTKTLTARPGPPESSAALSECLERPSRFSHFAERRRVSARLRVFARRNTS